MSDVTAAVSERIKGALAAQQAVTDAAKAAADAAHADLATSTPPAGPPSEG